MESVQENDNKIILLVTYPRNDTADTYVSRTTGVQQMRFAFLRQLKHKLVLVR